MDLVLSTSGSCSSISFMNPSHLPDTVCSYFSVSLGFIPCQHLGGSSHIQKDMDSFPCWVTLKRSREGWTGQVWVMYMSLKRCVECNVTS